MQTIKKYDIWLIDLQPTLGGEQSGVRPCLVFQSDMVSQYTTTFLVIPITSKNKNFGPVVVLLPEYKRYGLLKPSTILCFQLRTADQSRFIKKLGSIPDGDVRSEIREAVEATMDLADDFLE